MKNTSILKRMRQFAWRIQFPSGRIELLSERSWRSNFEYMVREEIAEIAQTVISAVHADVRRGIL